MTTLTPIEIAILKDAVFRPVRPRAPFMMDAVANLFTSGLIEVSEESEFSYSATSRGFRELASCAA